MEEIKYNKLQILNEQNKLYKMLKECNNKNKLNLDMNYLNYQIKNGMTDITYYKYSQEEKSFRQIIELMNNNNNPKRLEQLIAEKQKIYSQEELDKKISYLKDCFSKYYAGQFLSKEQRITISNTDEKIKTDKDLLKLKTHEMIHAITQGLRKDGKNLDVFNFRKNLKTNLEKEAFNMEDYTIVSGYATVKLDNNLNSIESKNNTYTEMCTESLAGIVTGENNTKDFKNFSVPSKMSAYYWTNRPRDLLVTALGSSDFLTDMLREDRIDKFESLKEEVNKKYNSNIIENFNDLLHDLGSQDNEEISQKANNEIEEQLTSIFIKRLQEKGEITEDVKEQIEFFKENLTIEKFKNLNFENEINKNKDNFLNELSDKTYSQEEVVLNESERKNNEKQKEIGKDVKNKNIKQI